MDLKNYQKRVIKDLNTYIDFMEEKGNYITAYNDLWESKGIRVDSVLDGSISPYNDIIEGCPSVCLKVPTAGGKTFIACNAIDSIFKYANPAKPKVVVRYVPTKTILEQTIRNLSNSEHPYRQKLNTLFNGKVAIYTKEQLLQGASFSNVGMIQDQLNILVLSFDSFRITDKEGRKVYDENGYLAGFNVKESYIEGVDKTALANILYSLNPVVIIDESHKAKSDLSITVLKDLNPSFILQLTATPTIESNIISIVSALELKQEEMVKLPVIAYNTQTVKDVVKSAVCLQKQLEYIAEENRKNGGKYIRPIVLFQAQQRGENETEEDQQTFRKIKEDLIKGGIDENEIAIETANIKELTGINLLDESCPIRYIITINALKEGWDCSFAYVLASLANKNSEIDVTQILGRILRQPYAHNHENEMLNASYVLTSSAQFQSTLSKIIEGLGQAGFSKRNSRAGIEENIEFVEGSSEKEIITGGIVGIDDSNGETENNTQEESQGSELEGLSLNDINIEEFANSTQFKKIQEGVIASTNESENKDETTAIDNSWFTGNNIIGGYGMIDTFAESAKSLKLPVFFIKRESQQQSQSNLFGYDNLLTKGDLLTGFRLSNQPIEVSFQDVDSGNLQQIDFVKSSGEEIARPGSLKQEQRRELQKYLQNFSEEKQKAHLIDYIKNAISDKSIADKDLKDYIGRIVEGLNGDVLEDMKIQPIKYASKIKESIERLQFKYAKEKLGDLISIKQIYTEPKREFPEKIFPTKKIEDSIEKMLYEKEDKGNSFEEELISKIAACDSVLWRHRNMPYTGFCINGPINHYPDFIVYTKKGNLFLVETKGDQLKNPDSELKIALGKFRSDTTEEKFHYCMVFEDTPMEGGYSIDKFLEIIKQL